MLNAKLVVVGGGDAKVTEIQLQLPTTIGRSREAKVKLPHPLVSRQHCEIFEREGQLFVRDLGSLNGTYVDSQKIESDQALEPNHLLTLGTVTFRAIYEISNDNGDAHLPVDVSTEPAPAISEQPTDRAETEPAKKPKRAPQSDVETENAAGDTDSDLPAVNPPDIFETVRREDIVSSENSSVFSSEAAPSNNGSAARHGIVGLPIAATSPPETESDNADGKNPADPSAKRRPR